MKPHGILGVMPAFRGDTVRRLRLIEFRGKYEIVTPAELRELPDDELAERIMERGETDESRARETLARIRGLAFHRTAYDRV